MRPPEHSRSESDRTGSATGRPREETIARRRIAGWLALTFAAFYVATGSGFIRTPDGTVLFRVTESLLERGRFDLAPLESWPDFGGAWTGGAGPINRRFYTWFGPGASVAALPFVAIGRGLLPLASERERSLFADRKLLAIPDAAGHRTLVAARALWYPTGPLDFPTAFLAFAFTWTNAAVTGGILAGLYLACSALGASRRGALFVALAAGLATPLWPYARDSFGEPLGALGAVWAIFFAVRRDPDGNPQPRWFLAGAMIAVAGFTKVTLFPLGLPLVLLAAFGPASAGMGARAGAVARSVLGVACGLAAVAAYNQARFGHVLTTGYGSYATAFSTPLVEGVSGLLASPGRGLLTYCPLVLAALVTVRRFAKREPAVAGFVALSLASQLLVFGGWFMWEGGWCWGPRFLVPVLPLLLLFLVPLASPEARRVPPFVAGVLAPLSAVVAFSGTLVAYDEYCRFVEQVFKLNAASWVRAGVSGYYELLRWDWAFSPLVRYWTFPVKDNYLFVRALEAPGLVLGVLVAAAFVALAGVVGLIRSGAFTRDASPLR